MSNEAQSEIVLLADLSEVEKVTVVGGAIHQHIPSTGVLSPTNPTNGIVRKIINIAEDIAEIGAIGAILGWIFKNHEHHKNPNQVPLSGGGSD
jgi:hypothetical protein